MCQCAPARGCSGPATPSVIGALRPASGRSSLGDGAREAFSKGRETLTFLFAPVSDAKTLRMPTWIARHLGISQPDVRTELVSDTRGKEERKGRVCVGGGLAWRILWL